MKLKNLILIAALAVTCASSAVAQGLGADIFGGSRTVVLTTGVRSGGTSGNITNNPIDLRRFIGIAKMDLVVTTNAGGGTLTANYETSNDLTNWVALTNYALATSTSLIYTNTYYGTSLFATNTTLLPGVLTNPTASTSGFATQYIAPAAYTNGGAITVTAGGTWSLGFNVDDQPRYLHVYFAPGGTTTNYSAATVLTAAIH